jgi:hypothetical protein
MSGIYANVGLDGKLQYGLGGNSGVGNQAALYQSATTPTPASTYSSLSVDATTAQNIQSGWSYSVSGAVAAGSQTVTFTSTAGGTYYGVCLYGSTGNVLMIIWPFPGAVVLGAGGTITLVLNDTQQQCS